MSYQLVNVWNKRVIVEMEETDSITNDIIEDIESDIEAGEEEGQTIAGYEWYILETRFIIINQSLFEINSTIEDSYIEHILNSVNRNELEFEKAIEKEYFIEKIGYSKF